MAAGPAGYTRVEPDVVVELAVDCAVDRARGSAYGLVDEVMGDPTGAPESGTPA